MRYVLTVKTEIPLRNGVYTYEMFLYAAHFLQHVQDHLSQVATPYGLERGLYTIREYPPT